METISLAGRREHLPWLDGVRGVAIILVFLFHALGASFPSDHLAWAGWHRVGPVPTSFLVLLPAYFGAGGVAMFFVISGFCIHWSHLRSRDQRWQTFFIRRFFRIYPPYLSALLIFAFWLPESRLVFDSRHNVDQVIAHLLLLHNDLGPGFIFGINPSFWSIGTEVQLYVLYPALFIFSERFGWKTALWVTAILEVTLRLVWGALDTWSDLSPWLGSNPLMFWFSWALGAVLADDLWRGRPMFLRGFPIWIWPLLAIGSYFVRPLAGFGFLLWALATATILARIMAGTPTFWSGFFGHRWLGKVGLISYSFYLLHQPLVKYVARDLRAAGWENPWMIYGGCVLGGLVILLISWGFFLLTERPSVAAGKWVLAKLSEHLA